MRVQQTEAEAAAEAAEIAARRAKKATVKTPKPVKEKPLTPGQRAALTKKNRAANKAEKKAATKKAVAAAKKRVSLPTPPSKMTEAREAKAAKAAAPLSDKQTKVVEGLVPIAKEINVRLEKAERGKKEYDDHRLAAALRLNEAKTKCEKAGLNFKKWALEHLKDQSYETVRKLAFVGSQKDPAAALADLRERTAKAVAEHRKRLQPARDPDAPKPEPFNVVKAAVEAIKAVPDTKVVKVLQDAADELGLKVTSKADPTPDIKPVAPARVVNATTVIDDWMTLTATDKVASLKAMADEAGYGLVNPLD